MRFLAVLIPLAMVAVGFALHEPLRTPQPVPRLIPHEAAWLLVMRHSNLSLSARMPDYNLCAQAIDHAAVQRSHGALTVRCEDRGL